MGALVRNERYISQAMAITRSGEMDWRDTSGCEHSERAVIPSVLPAFLILYMLFSCSAASCLTRCENARTAHSHGMMGCVHEASSLPPFDVTTAVEDELLKFPALSCQHTVQPTTPCRAIIVHFLYPTIFEASKSISSNAYMKT
jgi:hypothetical protein